MKSTKIEAHKSSLGMDANLAAVIVFVATAGVSWMGYIGWVAWAVPLIFFFLEKTSKYVKFYAVQALAIGIIRAIFAIVLQIFIWILTPRDVYSALNYALGRGWGIWVLLGAISTIIGIIITIIIIYLIVQAYGYKQVELPVIGKIATKVSKILDNMNQTSNSNPEKPEEPKPEEPQTEEQKKEE